MGLLISRPGDGTGIQCHVDLWFPPPDEEGQCCLKDMPVLSAQAELSKIVAGGQEAEISWFRGEPGGYSSSSRVADGDAYTNPARDPEEAVHRREVANRQQLLLELYIDGINWGQSPDEIAALDPDNNDTWSSWAEMSSTSVADGDRYGVEAMMTESSDLFLLGGSDTDARLSHTTHPTIYPQRRALRKLESIAEKERAALNRGLLQVISESVRVGATASSCWPTKIWCDAGSGRPNRGTAAVYSNFISTQRLAAMGALKSGATR